MKIDYEDFRKLQQLSDELKVKENQDKQLISDLIDYMIEAKIYPVTNEMKARNYTAFDMVRYYGPFWYEWHDVITQCESCGMDIRDHEKGPPYTTGVYYGQMWHITGLVICKTCDEIMKIF